jgi:uncharacterized protein Veg
MLQPAGAAHSSSQACDAALAKHVELYGDYGRQKMKRTYTVVVQGSKSVVVRFTAEAENIANGIPTRQNCVELFLAVPCCQLGRQACDAALAKHVELYGDYGRQKMKRTYTVVVQGRQLLARCRSLHGGGREHSQRDPNSTELR